MTTDSESVRYHKGAKKAWVTRKKKGWRRKTVEDRKLELLNLARKKLKGRELKQANKWLQHRFRSKTTEANMVSYYEGVLKD